MAPCLIGYGAIARRLYDDPNTNREGNKYWKWIEDYVEMSYVEVVKIGTGMLSPPSLSLFVTQVLEEERRLG